jgi:hypothetical protein
MPQVSASVAILRKSVMPPRIGSGCRIGRHGLVKNGRRSQTPSRLDVVFWASALPEFRVDDDLDLGCLDAPTALVDQRYSKSLAIHRRAERERRPAISDPLVAPFGHREEWQAKRQVHLRQRILNAAVACLLEERLSCGSAT